jgi:hypothetical protein
VIVSSGLSRPKTSGIRGEEEYASHEEDDREIAPDGQTRVKTDDI